MQDVGVNASSRKVLSADQISSFERDGHLCLEGYLAGDWLHRLQETTARMVEDSRNHQESNEKFDLEPDHTPDNPRLRRLQKPQDQDPVYYETAFNSPIVDVVEDLLAQLSGI